MSTPEFFDTPDMETFFARSTATVTPFGSAIAWKSPARGGWNDDLTFLG